jgi:protein-disulfide isomerase
VPPSGPTARGAATRSPGPRSGARSPAARTSATSRSSRGIAAAAGLDAAALTAAIADPAVKDDLRARTDAALALGVRGVPTVAVGDRLLYGDDRLEEAA